MKLLYCLVVLGLIQYGLTAVPMTPTRQQQKLLQIYNQEVEKLMKEHFARVKQYLEKVLQDNTIKQSSTPTFQYFKKRANQFLQKYQIPSQIQLHKILYGLVDFTLFYDDIYNVENTVMDMIKNVFEEMKRNYTKSYVSMVKEKFIPKFEEYKKQWTPKELKQQRLLMEWFVELKTCSSYVCYSNRLYEYPHILDFIFDNIGDTYVYQKLY